MEMENYILGNIAFILLFILVHLIIWINIDEADEIQHKDIYSSIYTEFVITQDLTNGEFECSTGKTHLPELVFRYPTWAERNLRDYKDGEADNGFPEK